jgi:hypothetical protein
MTRERGHLRLVEPLADGEETEHVLEDDVKGILLRAMALGLIEVCLVGIDEDHSLHLLSTCLTFNDDIAMLEKGKSYAIELDAEAADD